MREKLASVIRREISAAAFERWLASESWDMFSDSSAEAIDLVSSLHHLLSQRDDAVLDDRAFRAALVNLLNNVSESVLIGSDAIVPCSPDRRLSAAKAFWVNPSEVWSLQMSV